MCDSLQHSGQETTLNRQQRTENLETPSNVEQSTAVLLQAPFMRLLLLQFLQEYSQKSSCWATISRNMARIKEQTRDRKLLVEKMTSFNVTYGKDFLPLWHLNLKMFKSPEADGCCFYRPGAKQTSLSEEKLCEEADTRPKSYMSSEDVMVTWILNNCIHSNVFCVQCRNKSDSNPVKFFISNQVKKKETADRISTDAQFWFEWIQQNEESVRWWSDTPVAVGNREISGFGSRWQSAFEFESPNGSTVSFFFHVTYIR